MTIFITTANASMMDNGSWSLGYQAGYTGDYLQGISTRGWYENNGYEFNGFIANAHGDFKDSNADVTLYELEAKYMRALVTNQNSRFYVGLGAGYGRISGSIEATDTDSYYDWDTDEYYEEETKVKESGSLDTFLIKPLFGAEFMFNEIPELGINFEVSYGFSFWDIDNVDITLSSISVGLGMHYYF